MPMAVVAAAGGIGDACVRARQNLARVAHRPREGAPHVERELVVPVIGQATGQPLGHRSFLRSHAAPSSADSRCGPPVLIAGSKVGRSEEHTSELQSLMRISYAVFCLKKKKTKQQ